MNPPSRCRFCRLFAVSVAACAAVMGAWTTLQAWLEATPERSLGPLFKSLVASTAPAASGTALTLALVLWAVALRPAELRQELAATLKRGAAVALPGYVVASAVAVVAGLATVAAGRGRAATGLAPSDWLWGALAAALDSAIVLGLAWRFLPRLHGARLSLPGLLSVVVAVTVPLRATVALALSSLWSR